MRFLLSEKDRNNHDMQQDIQQQRDGINRKEIEISQQKQDVAKRSDQGFDMRKDIDNLHYEIGKLKEERAKDMDELNRL